MSLGLDFKAMPLTKSLLDLLDGLLLQVKLLLHLERTLGSDVVEVVVGSLVVLDALLYEPLGFGDVPVHADQEARAAHLGNRFHHFVGDGLAHVLFEDLLLEVQLVDKSLELR